MARYSSQQVNPSRSRRWLLQLCCASSIAAIVLASVFFVLVPFQQRNTQARLQAFENYRLHEKCQELLQIRTTLEDQERDLIQVLSSSYDYRCPTDKPLMQVVTDLVRDMNLQLTAFSEHATNVDLGKSTESSRVVDVRIQGEYRDACKWLASLTRLERPVRVTMLQLLPKASDPDQCTLHAELQFFQTPVRLPRKNET